MVTRRRELIAVLGAGLALPPVVRAQQAARKVPRVGILTPASSDKTPIFAAFERELRRLGYVEGRTITLEFRFAGGDSSRLAQMAAALVAEPVDVIVTDGTPAALIAGKATKNVPIVIGAGADPVMLGLAATHEHPGGNVTGFTLMGVELNAKRPDLFKAAIPKGTTLALLVNPSNAIWPAYVRNVAEAAQRMGVRVGDRVEAAEPAALAALAASAFARASGVMVLPDPMFWNHRQSIIALIQAARLPAIYPEREYAEEGGLMAYGPSVPDNFRRAAGYVDRILKGAKAGDLPVQEPAKFELVINLKAAKALGLALPPSLLAQADEIIE